MAEAAADPGAVFERYEFLAAEYGWKPVEVEESLTDEQIIGILDAAPRRVSDRFIATVESVRTGTVIAHDRKAADRWRRKAMAASSKRQQIGLTGAALEQAIRALALTHPEYVVEETA